MKTKILTLSGCSGCALLAIAGCPGVESVVTTTQPGGPTAAALITNVTETDPFQEWTQFPSATGVQESAPPHGPIRRTWINSVVQAAIADPTDSLPVDSIVIKENLADADAQTATTWSIMWKVDGFDPQNNDWFWAEVTPGGNVMAEGMVSACNACHGGARDNDFIFLQNLNGGN